MCMNDFEDGEDLTGEYKPDLFRPENVIERLKAQGISVTLEQTILIVELLDRLSNIIMSQKLRQCK
jgi:hypothetical protein